MAGRIFEGARRDGRLLDASEAGGQVEITGTQSIGSVAQGGIIPFAAKLFRVRAKEPTMFAIELASQVITNPTGGVTADQRIVADVAWQCGRGSQNATIDVGQGVVFTVAAAEVVDVGVRLRDSSSRGPTMRVQGTAAPAAAISPIPAYQSQEIALVATVESTAIEIPQWARAVRIYFDQIASSTAQVIFRTSNYSASGTRYVHNATVGESVPVVSGSNYLFLNSPVTTGCTVIFELTL